MSKLREQMWDQAKKKYRLSSEVVQMAKKLGLNPKKFGKYANHKQENWKSPLPDFIKELYEKRFSIKPEMEGN
jgi:hypothetical protein